MANPKQLPPKRTQQTSTNLRQQLDEGSLLPTIAAKGHSDIHIQCSDVSLLDRIIQQDANALESTTFQNQTIADYYVTEAMFAQMDTITDWVNDPTQDQLLAINSQFDIDETSAIGHGFAIDRRTGLIRERKTDSETLVFRKDKTNQYGFAMVTAYPNITTPTATETGRDLRPLVRKTPTYKSATPLHKAKLEHQCNPDSEFGLKHFLPIAGKPEALRFSIPTDDPEVEHVITITESETTMSTKRNGAKTASDFTNLSVKPYGQSDVRQDVDLSDPMVWQVFSSRYPTHARTIENIQNVIIANTPENTRTAKPYPKDDKMRQALLDYQTANPNQIGATFQRGDKPGSDQLSMRIPIDPETNQPIDDPTKTDKFHFVNIRANGASICTRQGREYVDSEFATPSKGKKFSFLSDPGMWEKFSAQYPEHAKAVTGLQECIKANIPYAVQPHAKQVTQSKNSEKPPETMAEIYERYRQNPERGIFVKHKHDPQSDKEWLNLYIPVDRNDMSRVVHGKTTDTQHILHIYPNRMTVSTLQNREFIPSNLTDIQAQYIPESAGNNKVYLNDDPRIWAEFAALYPKHAAVSERLQAQMQKLPDYQPDQPSQTPAPVISTNQPPVEQKSDKASRIARAETLMNNIDWQQSNPTTQHSLA